MAESSSSGECSSSGSSSSTGVGSILDRLKAAAPSELSRKRKVGTNPPPKGKRMCRGHGGTASEPKGVSPSQRVKENPDEALTLSNGKLFCSACREELSLKSSSIKSHVKSTKHQSKKQQLESTKSRERDIAQALVKYNEEVHMKGETLPAEMQVYRVKGLTAFLRAAVSLSNLEFFREFLEGGAYRLSDRRHMSDLIPFVLRQEQAKIKEEIEGKHVAVIFDGITYLGEALAIVLRFVSEDFEIKQRLIRLQLLAKSLTGEEIARELITVLSVGYGINPNLLLSAMRDGASSNKVAMRTLKVVYPHVFDVACFSHTLDRVGSHFNMPVLLEFINSWISLFSHSPKVKLLWKEKTGKAMGSYSATRWWSKWEVMLQVCQYFGDVEIFLAENGDVSPATRAKLLTFFQTQTRRLLCRLNQLQ